MLGVIDPKDALFWLGTTDAMPTDQYFVLAFDSSASDSAPSWNDLRAHIIARARATPALNKRLVESPAGVDYPVWVRDQLPMDDCVTMLGRTGSTWQTCVDDIATLLQSTLDAEITPWQLHIAERVRGVPYAEGPSTVVLVRLSHALTDGLGGAALLRALFGRTPRPADSDVAAEACATVPGRAALLARACGQAAVRLLRLLPALVSVAGAGRRAARFDADSAIARPTPRDRLSVNQCAASDRRLAVIPVPGRLATSREYTVTQLALTAASLATERLLRHRAENAEFLTALVPVAFPADADWQGANRFVPGMVSMGWGSADLETRAETIKASLTAERRRLANPDVIKEFRLVEAVPWPILRRVIRSRSRADDGQVTANLVFTSVNCGDGDMDLLGSPAVMVAGFPCLSESIGIGLGLYGIGDALTLGVLTAPNAVDVADGYVELLAAALSEVADQLG